ncbi:unnamed protein product [Tenebrio molitor]|nr:unnamed protein product [Tenebrio molitor]
MFDHLYNHFLSKFLGPRDQWCNFLSDEGSLIIQSPKCFLQFRVTKLMTYRFVLLCFVRLCVTICFITTSLAIKYL